MERLNTDYKLLYSNGVDKIRADENVFIELITKRSFSHLTKLIYYIKEEHGKSLIETIEAATSSDFCRALKTIVAYIDDPNKFYCYRLKKATNMPLFFTRLCVIKYENNLHSVIGKMEQYLGKSISDFLNDNISGILSKALLTLIKKV